MERFDGMVPSYFDLQDSSGQLPTPYWSPSTSSSTLSPSMQSPKSSSPNIISHQESVIKHFIQTEQNLKALNMYLDANLFYFDYNGEKIDFNKLSTLSSIASDNVSQNIKGKIAKFPYFSSISNDRNNSKSESQSFEKVQEFFNEEKPLEKEIRNFGSQLYRGNDQKDVSAYSTNNISTQGRRRSKIFTDGTSFPIRDISDSTNINIDTALLDITGRTFQHTLNKQLPNWGIDQNISSLSPISIKRRRQRSKTNSIVYAMNNEPIYPFSAEFSQVDRNQNLYVTSIEDQKNFKTKTNGHCQYSRAFKDEQSLHYDTLQQTVESAIKGIKPANDKDSLKRALAGSKTRKEQNREKSKRYYDRSKAQNGAISKLFTKIYTWYESYCLPSAMVVEVSRLNELITNTKTIAEQGVLEPSQKTKLIKMLEKDKTAAQITVIVLTAKELKKHLKLHSKEQIKEKIKGYKKRRADPSVMQENSLDIFASGLFVWIDCLCLWSDLILAEKRLLGKTGDRSILDLICFLSDLYN